MIDFSALFFLIFLLALSRSQSANYVSKVVTWLITLGGRVKSKMGINNLQKIQVRKRGKTGLNRPF